VHVTATPDEIDTEDVMRVLDGLHAQQSSHDDAMAYSGAAQYVAQGESRAAKTQRGLGAMNKRLFERLVESMQQHSEIARGERKPSRQFQVDAIAVKEIRAITHLSQPKFARLLDVDVGTLRNWEQGRREPTGPAKALLRAIKNDPEAVLKALANH
jgi:putative transcriptional regulator